MISTSSPSTSTAARESAGRSVTKSVRGMATSDGAGVKLTRVIGTPQLRGVGPFLMLDEFRSDEPQDYLAGFPAHPHRGFETFTYMLAGRFRHHVDGEDAVGAGAVIDDKGLAEAFCKFDRGDPRDRDGLFGVGSVAAQTHRADRVA